MSGQFTMAEDSMLRILSAARRPRNTWSDVLRDWQLLCIRMPELWLKPRSNMELQNRFRWLQLRDRRRHTKLLLGQAELLQQHAIHPILQMDSGPDEDISSDRDAANLLDGTADEDFDDGIAEEGSGSIGELHNCSVCQSPIDPGTELILPCARRQASPCGGHFCCTCMQQYVNGKLEEHGHHALVPLPLLPISFAAFICGHHRSIPEVVRGPAYAKVPRARGVGPDADARPA